MLGTPVAENIPRFLRPRELLISNAYAGAPDLFQSASESLQIATRAHHPICRLHG